MKKLLICLNCLFLSVMIQALRHQLFLFLLCVMGFSGFAQEPEDSSRFVLTYSFYNHAELVSKGTMTYRLTNDYLGITRRNLFDKKDIPLYSTNIRKSVSDSIRGLRMDTLQFFYHNDCVMSTSGNEYFISLETGLKEKRIHLHSYYHPQIERLIHIMNAVLPEDYRLYYMSKDNKQDCK